EEILMTIRANPLLAGVTFSGGEPFRQPMPLAHLAREVRALGLDIWCYTGYTLDELCAMQDPGVDALLDELDVLVDGPFVLAERDLTLRFRGSRNQRVIDMKATRECGEIVLKYRD
ncbi:MAG: radical SAM protein, partial [Schwartzia sp.]|nr:radical SAM protein [Schwartzia sp. (in: firmicutes)]